LGPVSDADPIDTAWQGVEAAWNDESRHRAFVGLCLALGRLPDAGRRYREVRDRDPGRRAEAERQIDRVLAVALQQLELGRSAPPPARRLGLTIVAAVLSTVMIAGVLWLWVGR
jgi:hypothetical protein